MIFEFSSVNLFPGEETVHVASPVADYLCLWNDKEGEIIIDGKDRPVTALEYLDKYLISETIRIWNNCTRRSVHDSIDLQSEVESLHPVTGRHFAVVYNTKAGVRECELGDSAVGRIFAFEPMLPFTPVASRQ